MEFKFVVSDSGIKLVYEGCSKENVSTSLSEFNSNLNDTFRNLRSQLNAGNHFAVANQLEGPVVYAMVQCRDYMSTAECIACFSAASIEVRNCSATIGGRVVYDGCFLRSLACNIIIFKMNSTHK
ncbi:hypothetical protein JCGZ_00133 [Jatropha curcas]|uniref:Gnk2-homologous domain-containing protein n=1 Tax=Jatropha curcas TaxID=180498 RepID=A0A067JIM1_JATCU|nr:hypothetical protein JCGZ_00133 [Jatropha curcas]